MSTMVPADRALLEQLGARIREIRESKKLTQDEVAERAGFGGKYIGEIEKGLRDVPVSTLRAVAENGLGIRFDALFNGKRSPRRSRTLAVPRDVEIAAEILSKLPMSVRRPLMALIKAMSR
jgi:transcriptional regulator with XRE-family HTH domain